MTNSYFAWLLSIMFIQKEILEENKPKRFSVLIDGLDNWI